MASKLVKEGNKGRGAVLSPVKKAEEYWNSLGPGLTTGASDDDPSGIATYSQAGARFGSQLLWLAAFTFPLMAVVQEMCARIGLVTGRGLASNIRQHFKRPVLFVTALLLFVANTFNIGADLGAMAKAVELLVPGVPVPVLVIAFAFVSLMLQILIPYGTYARYLKWLALVLLAYVFTGFIVGLDWSEVFKSAILPSVSFSREQIFLICGILGTTISPYLFFWQTSQEVEEQILEGKTSIKKREGATSAQVKKMRIDVWSGMLLSNIVMFFIIAVCAVTLNAGGITNIQTAEEAARALEPIAGRFASLLFAVGIIGTGLLAVPVLAGSASYAIAETFGWREGLYRNFRQAQAFYGVIIASMIAGLLMNFVGLDAIKALVYSAVINGVVAPLVLVLIVLLSSNKKIMGEWVNSKSVTYIGWLTTALMSVVALAVIISLF